MRLMRSSTMRSSKSVANMGRWRMLSSTRYGMQHAVNTTDEKTLAGEARWLWRRWSACQNFCRIPREHRGQEGKERPWWKVIVLKFHAISFHSFITDILVDGRCQLWSTTRRCTISKIFQPRRFLQNFPHMAGGSLKSKSCTRHGEAWLAVAGDIVYLFWPARSWHPWALKLFMYVKVSLSTYWRETIKMWMHIYENENIE